MTSSKQTMVPELHSGLLDLIRVLGKLAHCASRTTIICEPFVPFHTSTRYHKNCSGSPSPLEATLKQLRSRPSSFWNPIQPKTYYYNCFNYQNVPARNEHYKEIDDKYEQIKQNKLCYDPPDCGDDLISKFLSDSDTRIRHKEHNERLLHDKESGPLRPTKVQSAPAYRPGQSAGTSSRPDLGAQDLGVKPESKTQGLGVRPASTAPTLNAKPDSRGPQRSMHESRAQAQSVKPESKTQAQGVKPEPKTQVQGVKRESKTQGLGARPESTSQTPSAKSDSRAPQRPIPESRAHGQSLKPESKYGVVDPKIAKPESSSSKRGPKSVTTEHDEKSKGRLKADEIKSPKGKSTNQISSNYDKSDLSLHSEESRSTCNLGETSESDSETQVRKLPSSASSKKSMTKSARSAEAEDLYKSDVEELKEMIQRLENENLLRYQAMLNLMREMSTKDFCRATCDREISGRDFCRGAGAREMKEVKDSSSVGNVTAGATSGASSGDLRTKSAKCARFDNDLATSSGSSLASESEKSFKLSGRNSPKMASSQSKLSANHPDALSKTSFHADAEMTLHNLMEMSSIIADVVVFETVKELMRKSKYRAPCKEEGKPFEKEEQGTIDSPFETAANKKAAPAGKSATGSKKTHSEPLPSKSGGKIAEKSSVMEDASVSREPFVETQSIKSSHATKQQIPSGPGPDGKVLKNTIPSKKIPPEDLTSGGSVTSNRSKTKDSNKIPQVQPTARAAPKSENIASEPKRNPECPKHGTSPKRSTGSFGTREEHETSQSTKSTCRKYENGPPTKPEPRRMSPCTDGRPPKPSSADGPKSRPQEYSTGSAPEDVRQNVKSTGRKYDTAPPTKPEIRMSPCADGRPPMPTGGDRSRSPTRDISSDYNDGTVLYYTRTTKNAFPPQKDSANAAGFMLRSAYDYNIQPRSVLSVKTDLFVELPPNSYGRLAPRNCLTKNFGIDVIGDVIDHDYGDTVTVVLINHSDTEVPIKRGAKIAQLICERIYQPKLQERREQSPHK
ncbi:unnamed protein product [Nesidiocoris tenuis]|uniref:dUTP diphosphatase n=1 Tax=Nesidiocoris tenuis TaxID=355587 RepID=A0A6H5GNB9_9HEMI|nr:unnamed protein product [Nesidiocoris tenuis]